MSIQSIETRYAGCRFRSRLEARWAVFFDALGAAWEYEPQGFLVGDKKRPYLPDFRVQRRGTDQAMWVEVKGTDDDLDLPLLGEAVASGNTIGGPLLILGPVPEPDPTPTHGAIRSIFGQPCLVRVVLARGLGLMQFGREHALDSEGRYLHPVSGPAASTDGWRRTDLLLDDSTAAAYTAARSARFEHGERG